MIVSCRRFVEIITAAEEDALPAWERRYFDEHAVVCPQCRSYVEGFERTVELLCGLPGERPPEAMREALLARFRAATSPKAGQDEGDDSGVSPHPGGGCVSNTIAPASSETTSSAKRR